MDARPLLLIEDDDDDILFMRRALNGAGIKNPLCVIQDGEVAVTYLQKLADEAKPSLFPCLVLLDLKLPRRNGLEVLRWIRTHKLLKNLVVVMLTSSSEPQDIKSASELGANSFLAKPNSHDDLNDLVIRLKAYWLEADLLVKL